MKTEDLSKDIESKSIPVWAKNNRLIQTSQGWEPYTVKDYPYLLEVLRSIQNPDVDRVIIQAGTQVGKTEAAVSALFWFLLQKGESCLFMLPHQSALSDFSSSRLNPIIENSPRLKAGFDKVNNVRLKTTKQGSSLYLRAAGVSDAQMEEFSVSALFRDEFAHYGDKVVELSEKRLGSAENPTIVDLGHPLYSGNRLSQAYSESSQFEWHYTCPDCKETQKIDFFEHYYDRGGELGCSHCGKSWTKDDILSDGFWKALGSEDNSLHGYRIPRTISPNQDLKEMGDAYQKSQSKGGTRIAVFNQTYLAQEFSASGQTLSPGEVKSIMIGPSTASVDPEDTILGVDVGKPLYYCVLKDEKVLAFGKAETYDELSRVRDRWDAKTCALDAAPEYHKSREWVEGLPTDVRGWLITTKGKGHVHPPKANLEKRQIQIHQVESFDRLFESVRKKNLQLPSDSPPQVEVHFTDPVKLVEEDKPSIEKGESHWCDSVRYAQAAQVISGEVPTPSEERVFDNLQSSNIVDEVPTLDKSIVIIHSDYSGSGSFLLLNYRTDKKKIYLTREWVRDKPSSFPDPSLYENLKSWLVELEIKEDLAKLGNGRVEPSYVYANETLAQYIHSQRDEFYLNVGIDEFDRERGLTRLLSLIEDDLVKIHTSCEVLIDELEAAKWDRRKEIPLEDTLVLPAAATGIQVYANWGPVYKGLINSLKSNETKLDWSDFN